MSIGNIRVSFTLRMQCFMTRCVMGTIRQQSSSPATAEYDSNCQCDRADGHNADADLSEWFCAQGVHSEKDACRSCGNAQDHDSRAGDGLAQLASISCPGCHTDCEPKGRPKHSAQRELESRFHGAIIALIGQATAFFTLRARQVQAACQIK